MLTVIGDITSIEDLAKLPSVGVDYVIHLAAAISVQVWRRRVCVVLLLRLDIRVLWLGGYACACRVCKFFSSP